MKRAINFILLIVSILNLSCASKNNDKERHIVKDVFLEYLKEAFNESDFKNEKMYIVIPCSGCKGCDQSVYSLFAEKYSNITNATLIICNPDNKDFLPPPKTNNVLLDSSAFMANYDFGYGYPSCFIIKDNTVIDRYTYSPSTIKSKCEQ
jgi:hypothetical protein